MTNIAYILGTTIVYPGNVSGVSETVKVTL